MENLLISVLGAAQEEEKEKVEVYKWDSAYQSYVSRNEEFQHIFNQYPLEEVKVLSRESRERYFNDSSTVAYGEIDYNAFGMLLLDLQEYEYPQNPSYVDLGAGVGRCLFSAHFLSLFTKCTGIEVVPSLFNVCLLTLRKYNNSFNNFDAPALHCILGDATYIDWSSNDVVFAHATCFDSNMVERLARTAAKMKPDSFFIILANR